MNRRITISLVTNLAMLIFCGGAFAQTFTVNSRTTPGGDLLRLDQSIDVVYNVSASGLSQGVVPVLRPVDGSLADSISVTWQGSAATSVLNNLAFKIHLYDDDSLCSQSIAFELAFYSAQFTGERLASTPNPSIMSFASTGGGQVNLTHQIVETRDLPWPLSSVSPNQHILFKEPVSVDDIRNPNNRLYFYCDYNLGVGTWAQQFNFFLFALNDDFCTFNPPTDMNSLTNVSGDVIDQTVSPAQTVTQAPLGGSGVTRDLGQGINIFDITDINPLDSDCASSVRDSVDYNANALYQLFWSYTGNGMVVRRFALYLGTEGGCDAITTIFGPPPASGSFQVQDFRFDTFGNVSATLAVPSAWGSSSTLNGNFRLQWFLRSDSKIISLGGESTSLTLPNVASGERIDNPEEYYLEARIRDTASDAMVSTTSAGNNHNLNYSIQPVTFQNAEQTVITGAGPDEFLDPGEIVALGLRLTQPGGGTLPSLNFDHGLVIDSNPNGVVDSGDTFLTDDDPEADGVNVRFYPLQTSGGSSDTTITLSYELLTAHALPAVWFYADVARAGSGGTSSSFRYYLSLKELFGSIRDLNAEITDEVFDYNFMQTAGSDWSVNNDNSTLGSRGFSHSLSNGYLGDGGSDVANADDLYRLNSPIFGLGTGTSIYFEHLPQFSFNQSGGLFEYRTRTNSSSLWSEWDNLISDYCGNCGYYSDFPFPSQPTSYLSGQRVWMSNESATEEVDVDIPDSLSLSKGEIQYRFVFSDPSLVDTGRSDGPTHWEVYNFTYETTRLTEDNIFGVDFSQLTLDACDDPALTFLSWAPVGVNNLTFEWYGSLDNLYDDISTGDISGAAGAAVPFNPSTNGEYHYYVRVKYQGTERIIRVIVNKTMTCTSTCITTQEAINQIRSDVSASWPGVKKVTDCVIVINRICR